jgi:hypothetical protein
MFMVALKGDQSLLPERAGLPRSAAEPMQSSWRHCSQWWKTLTFDMNHNRMAQRSGGGLDGRATGPCFGTRAVPFELLAFGLEEFNRINYSMHRLERPTWIS